MFSLNVITSAFSESYPKFIFVGLAILYLNDLELSVTLGTKIGTTFLNEIIIVVGWSTVILSSCTS